MRKFNLSFMAKVTLMVVVFIALTAVAVGHTTTSSARGLLIENALHELGDDVEINSVRLVAGIDALRHDTIFLSNLPEVHGIRRAIEAGGVDPVDLTTDALWRTQLIGVYSELLVSKPHYVRLQYISTQNALELVRVENSEGAIRVLGRRELNMGVADDYFLAAQTLAPGAVYLSDIRLQRDNSGALVEPQTIVMYASTPIYSEDGSVFGVIAIGLDFGATFKELLALKKDGETVYVTNQAGDFLLNSADPALTFGFETGQQYRIQDTFETLAPLFAPGNTLQELPASPDTGSNPLALHFRRVSFDQLTPDRYLGLAVATPYSQVVGAVDRFADQVALITGVLVAGGVILAVILMRALIRPLYQITIATKQISEGRFDIHLPVQSQDEFGQLAAGFNQMAEAIQEREQELIEVNRSLERRVEERTGELNQFRALAEYANDAIMIATLDGTITYANPASYQLYGYDQNTQALIGKHFIHLVPEDARQFVEQKARNETLSGAQYAEIKQLRNDGATFDAAVSSFNIFDEAQQPVAMAAIMRDISERKQAEADRLQTQQERERLQQQIIEAQKQAILELSTPIIPLMDGIVVMPLVGAIDTARSGDIMRSLLHGITEHRARIAIIDITGVPVVDSGVADHLNRTIQAARLKGAQTIITGISDAVAEAVVDLGIDWSGVETLRSLQAGLIAALERLGVKLGSNGHNGYVNGKQELRNRPDF